MDVKVAPALPSDAPAARKLYLEVIGRVPYYNGVAKKYQAEKYLPRDIRRMIKDDRRSVLLAKDEAGRLVGFLFSGFDHMTIWADWIGVKRGARGKGVAALLTAELIATAPARGAHKVWCDSRSNNRESIRLLRKFGFRKIGLARNHWYGQDFYLWERFV